MWFAKRVPLQEHVSQQVPQHMCIIVFPYCVIFGIRLGGSGAITVQLRAVFVARVVMRVVPPDPHVAHRASRSARCAPRAGGFTNDVQRGQHHRAYHGRSDEFVVWMCWAQCFLGSGQLGVAHVHLIALQVCTFTGLQCASCKWCPLARAKALDGVGIPRCLPAAFALCASFAAQCAPFRIACTPNCSNCHSSCGFPSPLSARIGSMRETPALSDMLGEWQIGFFAFDDALLVYAGTITNVCMVPLVMFQ